MPVNCTTSTVLWFNHVVVVVVIVVVDVVFLKELTAAHTNITSYTAEVDSGRYETLSVALVEENCNYRERRRELDQYIL